MIFDRKWSTESKNEVRFDPNLILLKLQADFGQKSVFTPNEISTGTESQKTFYFSSHHVFSIQLPDKTIADLTKLVNGVKKFKKMKTLNLKHFLTKNKHFSKN